MGNKVYYNGVEYDSLLEVDYSKYLDELKKEGIVKSTTYHPKSIRVNKKNTYTPDFIVEYADRIEIIETKGFNPYSRMRDDIIHNFMQELPETTLKLYVASNGYNHTNKSVIYRKIKHLKSYGFVDFNFKNPNTIANQRKEKLEIANAEIKELKTFKNKALRYYSYIRKIKNNEKLTKQQRAWLDEYEKEMNI